MKRQCKYCNFCKEQGRMQSQRNRLGRKKYYCVHPETKDLTDDRGRPIYNFVGFGDMTYPSPLTLKTSKKWCPAK
ncbi:hypothetical protein SAMN04487969_11942 [Paenibacillus algorifonticola]|uniref:Uncharacterized protein n=1 Tax=Paenibacillus algorifonticola TaxID=684063 RepID=A0A1I2GYB1_9BACL|nr:hypothetical protein SAMN04487969_11942 [Paenibacillus algorifonticola]